MTNPIPNGYHTVTPSLMLKSSKKAIEFYKKLGAAPLEDWKIFRLTGDGITKLAES